jgi:hydrogenase maturation protease
LSAARVVVIGVGNSFRCDDAAGLEVVQRLDVSSGAEIHAREGDLAGLADLWDGASSVIVVDSARSPDTPPGTIHRFDALARELPTGLLSSTHAFGVAEAIELARALGRLPASLTVYAIEGSRFEVGQELSPEVSAAIDGLVDELTGRLSQAAAGTRREP